MCSSPGIAQSGKAKNDAEEAGRNDGKLMLACHVGPLDGGAIRIALVCVVDDDGLAAVVPMRGRRGRFRFASCLRDVSRHGDG